MGVGMGWIWILHFTASTFCTSGVVVVVVVGALLIVVPTLSLCCCCYCCIVVPLVVVVVVPVVVGWLLICCWLLIVVDGAVVVEYNEWYSAHLYMIASRYAVEWPGARAHERPLLRLGKREIG